MQLWTAFILGMVGSLHCAGMCGPLALALPATGSNASSFIAGQIAYNGGRILTYCFLGVVFGIIGQTLALAGLQRWVSLAVGVAIIAGLIGSSRYALAVPFSKSIGWLKSRLAMLLHQRSIHS